MNKLQLFLLAVVLVIGQGCKDDENALYDYQTIWNRHYETTWTYESTKNKIAGVWEWRYVKCCGEATKPYQNGTESEGLRINFNKDGTGIIINQGVFDEFTWDIEQKDNDLYGFQTTPAISQLSGRVLFGDQIMMCNDSYIDGADNFFRKIETSGD